LAPAADGRDPGDERLEGRRAPRARSDLRSYPLREVERLDLSGGDEGVGDELLPRPFRVAGDEQELAAEAPERGPLALGESPDASGRKFGGGQGARAVELREPHEVLAREVGAPGGQRPRELGRGGLILAQEPDQPRDVPGGTARKAAGEDQAGEAHPPVGVDAPRTVGAGSAGSSRDEPTPR
jgi:hypothetical protein